MDIRVKTIDETYDVIVVGGGPAGITAAIAAARSGARVLLLEAASALGGMSTLGMVPFFSRMTDGNKCIFGGLAKEVVSRYKERAGIDPEKWRGVIIYPEVLKTLYTEMMEEAGVKVLYFSTVCDVVMDGDRIGSVLVGGKNGIRQYRAKEYIDCTGDGDIAAATGTPMEYGNEDEYVQEASLCFIISNCYPERQTKKISTGGEDNIILDILRDGKYPLVTDHFVPRKIDEHTYLCNAGSIVNVDTRDAEAVTKAMEYGRRVANEFLAALKEYMPEVFAESSLAATAPLLGIRESRRLIGQYVLTAQDYYERKSFPDEISRNCNWLDRHIPYDMFNPCETAPGEYYHYSDGESHGLPWRMLVPQDIKNLLVAGRCASMDYVVFSSVRVMPNCMAMGHAAGVGAAIAAAREIAVQDIPAADVIAHLA